MKRILFFITCMMTSMMMFAQEGTNDYLPFVELGKKWHVVIVSNPNYVHSAGKYWMCNEVERNGKTYIYTYLPYDEIDVVEEVGLLREENRRVYKYDEASGRDIMLYDFSLNEGDTFIYEYGLDHPVNCKVLKQGWLEDGPKIVSSYSTTSEGTTDVKYRKLRTWTIGCDDGTGDYHEVATWVEGVGALKNMFHSPFMDGVMFCLSYVERKPSIDNWSTPFWKNEYLPFSFCTIFDMFGQIHGCNLPTGRVDNEQRGNPKRGHQLTYELEGNHLHVYGNVYSQCGPFNYAYFYEKSTDNQLVRKIEFEIQEVEPVADCMAFHTTDFYIPGFDPNMNYIVVDNYGEEHPVIKKTPQIAYRPFVEEGKVWKVGYGSSNPTQLVEYYYFDGDTIIGGKTCKQMMCQRYVTPDHSDYEIIMRYPLLQRSGVWYELDKKVYVYDDTNKKFKIMYDFSVDANDTLQIVEYAPPYVLGPRQTGGMKGFKGVYRDVMTSVEGENHYNITWIEGVGSIEGPKYNVYYGKEYHGGAFLMSCAVGDEVIYLNDEYEDGTTPEGIGAQKRRFDFTHTTKEKPKAPMLRSAEQSLYGEYNNLQLGINLEPIDDTYMVHITDTSGNAVYEKAINAGSIVGLNIDISNYAKGRYTVTVENSQEVFTGEFEAQATGIEEVNLTPVLSKGEGTIFNLQGQRLSSLQRGLNIVNGQKVYVK